jgi:GR25 family glycosyltransferase involved in LPS biosynthesis
MHLVCINIESARVRWDSIDRQVRFILPDAILHRIDAIHWRTLSNDLREVSLTPFSRYLIQNPEYQTKLRVSHRQMDTISSVAIMLSHVKCWTWLRERPDIPWVLVLEDDACFDINTFPDALAHWVRPLGDMPHRWDCVVLGYFAVEGLRPMQLETLELASAVQFFGAHAYMLSQHGAAVLLHHVFPIDQQVDGYMLTLHQIGVLRMYMTPVSTVSQCMDTIQRFGSYHTHTVSTETPMQDVPSHTAVVHVLSEPSLILDSTVSVEDTDTRAEPPHTFPQPKPDDNQAMIPNIWQPSSHYILVGLIVLVVSMWMNMRRRQH